MYFKKWGNVIFSICPFSDDNGVFPVWLGVGGWKYCVKRTYGEHRGKLESGFYFYFILANHRIEINYEKLIGP